MLYHLRHEAHCTFNILILLNCIAVGLFELCRNFVTIFRVKLQIGYCPTVKLKCGSLEV
jgi:hypothetical protein